VKFRRKLQKINIPVEAMPVPRKLSASCGIAVRFTWLTELESLLDEGIEKVYACNANEMFLYMKQNNKYSFLWECYSE
jgi:hypothetical protein